MHKTIWSVIGVAVTVVILVMAYRIYDGAGATAKVGDIEVTVDPKEKMTAPLPSAETDSKTAEAPSSAPVCDGAITSLLTNNIAEVNRWIKTKDNLKVRVLALSSTEADLSISDSNDNTITTLTIRAGRVKDFIYLNQKYKLKINSIYEVRGDLTVNVTMHKVKCA